MKHNRAFGAECACHIKIEYLGWVISQFYTPPSRQFVDSMKDYIKLNKNKLIKTFKWTAIILTALLGGYTYKNCNTGNCFATIDFMVSLLVSVLFLPALLAGFEILTGYIEYWRSEKFFESIPIAELLKNGFVKDYTEKESTWMLSKLCWVGKFGNYEMICEIESNRLRVIAKTDYSHLDDWDNKEIHAVLQAYKHGRFEFDSKGIATSLKVKDVRKMTYADFVNYLEDFTKLLTELKVN